MSGYLKIVGSVLLFGLTINFMVGAVEMCIDPTYGPWIVIPFVGLSGAWMLGALIVDGPSHAFHFLRYWIAVHVGLVIALLPFAVPPHPWLILAGVWVGIGVGSWIASGKFR